MIKFHGVDLTDIAPVRIDDIRVNPVQVTPVARQHVGFGQDFVRMTGMNRTIVITFALLESDLSARFQAIQDIIKWARPFEECQLALPMDESKYFECRCTGHPEPSYRQWWESKLHLVFTTFENPYWTSNDLMRVRCGQLFDVRGTAPPLMQITRTLSEAASNQTYSAGGRSMTFSQIPAGDLVIDLNRQTAEVNGSSIMQYFGKTGKFIEPATGGVTIAGTGFIFYRERWV